MDGVKRPVELTHDNHSSPLYTLLLSPLTHDSHNSPFTLSFSLLSRATITVHLLHSSFLSSHVRQSQFTPLNSPSLLSRATIIVHTFTLSFSLLSRATITVHPFTLSSSLFSRATITVHPLHSPPLSSHVRQSQFTPLHSPPLSSHVRQSQLPHLSDAHLPACPATPTHLSRLGAHASALWHHSEREEESAEGTKSRGGGQRV